jgi:hypothetical protein
MTDEEIKSIIYWKYRGGPDSPMGQIIFEIACYVRDRVQTWTESDIILNLRERLKMAEDSKAVAWRHLKEADNQNIWRERYYRLHKIHVEDVRRRKETRKFRLTNFSIAELEEELKSRLERKNKNDRTRADRKT